MGNSDGLRIQSYGGDRIVGKVPIGTMGSKEHRTYLRNLRRQLGLAQDPRYEIKMAVEKALLDGISKEEIIKFVDEAEAQKLIDS